MPTPEEIQASIALFDADVQRFNDILLGDENAEVEMSDETLRPSITKAVFDKVDLVTNTVIYESTAAGLAATTSGQYFNVVSSNNSAYVDLYLNASGTATHQKTYPSLQAITDLDIEKNTDVVFVNQDEVVYAITDNTNKAVLSIKEDGTVSIKLNITHLNNGLVFSKDANLNYTLGLDSGFIDKGYDNSDGIYALTDSNERKLLFIDNDGTFTAKFNLSAGDGLAVERLSSGAHQYSLDENKLNFSYGAIDYLYTITDSNNKLLFAISNDGTIIGKLGISASGGLSVTQLSTGVYNFALDPALIDTNYGGSDYLAAICDSEGRILFSVGFDGTITGKITVTEVVTARGNRTDLDTRLSQNLTAYGMPKCYTWGEWFLRETRMRLRKRAMSESVQLNIAMIGDSWTHGRDRYSKPISTALKTAFGDAGAGWTGFGWGGGGAPDVWVGGNGNVDTDVLVTLTTGWSVHYNSSVSPDIADIYTSTAGAKVTTTFSGTGNVSVAKLFYIAGGSGVLRYRWNGGAWTALDISAGSGLLTTNLASVPTGTWTLEIENVSGTTTICGVDIQKTTDGVRVHKLGGTGSASNQWAGVDSSSWKNGITALAPNLVTILLGTNDQGGSMATATYRTNLQTMITRIKEALPFADVALIMPCENQRVANTYAMSLYAKEAYELAAINNCAWLDLQYVFGDTAAQYAYGSARPWFAADLIHPDPNTGGRAITDAVYRLLTTQ